MKKIIALVLCLVAILPLCACSSGELESTPVKTEQKPTATADPSNEEKPVTVPDPLTWEKINAIPVATSDMTEDQLRQICADYFRLQLSYQWTPSESFQYRIEAYDRTVNMRKGTVYVGSPYDGGQGNLYKIMNNYDSETGVLTTSQNGEYVTQIIGNHCTSASHWGWSRVSNTYRCGLTQTVTEANGALKLGNYQYPNEKKEHKSTREVCDFNGEQVMYQSYALLKLADGVINFNGAGHVMMISKAAHVEYLPDGTIDGKNSYVLGMEQISSWTKRDFNGVTLPQQGNVDKKYTFQQLFKSSYLPFTIKELIGQDPVEKGYATLEVKDTPALEDLAAGKIVSNYEISDITVRILDPEGKEAYRYITNCSWNVYEKKLNNTIFPASISPFVKKGGHRIEILCRIGTGELFTVYSGELTK
ncbi:MAG: hypothetical protein E7580_06805 [Ruminococcaceae bacterium]|nr:hypothetical protein [Oscillospiraceae bacterium]